MSAGGAVMCRVVRLAVTRALWIAVAFAFGASAAFAQTPAPTREHYDAAYIGAPLADPVLQQSKETYVVFGCAYCHGVNLTPRGEAADLRTSRIVGRDVDGDLLGPLLRAGIPQTAKLSPMPQFSDLSDRQIGDLVRWMHYARQEARYAALTSGAPAPAGDAAAGRAAFEQSCRSCHASETTLGTALAALAPAAQVRALLKPRSLQTPRSFTLAAMADEASARGRARHGAWLENVSAAEVEHLRTFLLASRR